MNEQDISKLPYVLIAAAFLSMSLFVALVGFDRVLTLMPDDAAYYYKIAENASEGKGLTFDGINRTNGFQPMWLAALVPLYRAYHGAPETMSRVILVLQTAILAAAALLLSATLARFFSRRTVIVSLLLFLFFVFVPAANGMESAVLVFFLALAFYAGARMAEAGGRDPKRELLLGVLLGFVVLARLDMIFLPLVAAAASLLSALGGRGERRARLAGTLCLGAGVTAVVLPYLVYNKMSFGAVMPISGLLKSSFPRLSDPAPALSSLGKRALAGLVIAAVYAAYSIARLGRARSVGDAAGRAAGRVGTTSRLRFYRSAMTVTACAILLHFLHTIFFMKWAVFNWHYVPYILFGAVAVCEPVDRFLAPAGAKGRRALYWIAIAAIVAVGGVSVLRIVDRPYDRDWGQAAYAAALWARDNTNANAVFAMKDAGNFSYFSERRVVNLDGVVNNLEYQAALRERNLRAYLAIKGVDYLVQHAFWDRPDVTRGEYDSLAVSYRSHRYECDSDSLVLRRSDEVYRSRPYFDGPYETVFIVWRIRGGA
jgi:hypothetical protein